MLSLQKRPVLDLRKDAVTAIQANGLFGQQANVIAVFDRSGSMNSLYRTGQVQCAADRTLALAAEFDDDGQVDVIAFHNSAYDCGKMDMKNHGDFIQKQIIDRLDEGGTSYAPVMRTILSRYGNPPGPVVGGTFGFGGKPTLAKAKLPTYVLFFTDGDNDDHVATEALVRESRKHAIFWQFVGLGNAAFSFLRKLDDMKGDGIDNADFFPFNGNATSDVELYKKLLNEFPGWVKSAKKAGIL